MLRRVLLAAFVLSALLVVSNTSAPARLGLPAAHDTPRRAEAASGALLAAPANNLFDTPSTEVGSPPLNYDFSQAGANWTYGGDVDFEDGHAYLRSQSGQSYIQSSLYVLDSEVEEVRLRWRAPDQGFNSAEVWVYDDSGAAVSYRNLISCGNCEQESWVETPLPVGGAKGDTVKVKVIRAATAGEIQVDYAGVQWDVLPEWAMYSNNLSPRLASDASHGNYALLSQNLEIVSETFTLRDETLEVDYAFPQADDHDLLIQVWESAETPDLLCEARIQCSACTRDWTTQVIDVSGGVGENVYVTIHNVDGQTKVDNTAVNQVAAISASDWHSATAGDPFDTTTGQSMHSHTDLLIPGRGIPLEFTRRYLSLSGYVGDLGPRWSHTYSASLRIDGNGSVSVRYGHGGTAYFHLDGGSFTAPPGNYDTLVQNPDDTYTLTTKSQISYDFSEDGRLEYIRDRNDNTTTLAYDGSDRLSSVTDSSGRALTFGYEDGNYPNQITSVTDPMASPDTRTVEFAYDAGTGDLVTVTDVKGGTTTYEYDNHRMTTLTDANENVASRNFYDTAGRVAEQWDAEEHVTCVYYGTGPAYGNENENCPGVTPEPDPGQTVVVDPLGHKSTYDFDTSFRTTDVTDALSGVVHYDYDSDNNPTCVTDQEGHKTAFSYSPTGNVTDIIDAENTDPLTCLLKDGGKKWTFTYTALNDIDLETDPRDNKTEYIYDGSGNLTRVIRKDAGNVVKGLTCLERDGFGQLAALVQSTDLVVPPGPTDPCTGHRTTFTYDAYGLLDEVDGPLASTPNDLTNYDFDVGGRLESVTDAEGNTTSFQYDAQNNVVEVIDALGQVTTYGYDAKGNRTSVTNAARQPVNEPETGEPQCGAAGTGNGVDDDGDDVPDDGCPSAIFQYWDSDRLKSVTDALAHVTSYDYDDAGRLWKRTDARDLVTTYEYDEVNRLTDVNHWQTWDPPVLADTVEYAYYPDGLRQSMADSTGTTSYDYYYNNQLEKVTKGATFVQYTYDPAGNRDTIKYPGTPAKTVAYTYDAFDRMETVTDWLGNLTEYDYDNVGNLRHTYYPPHGDPPTDDLVSTRTYDDADRLISVVNTNAAGTISSFSYDMDAVGNRTQLTETTDVTDYTDYTYDQLYRLRAVLNVDSQFDTYSYDSVGNRATKWLNPYEYDAGDQMESAYRDHADVEPNHDYDGDGDGCTKSEEAALGGVFDPNAYYDVYDVPVPAKEDAVGDGYGDDEPPIGANGTRNGVVDIGDVLAVLEYAFADPGGPPNANGVDYDSDKGIDMDADTVADIPPDGVPDGIEYDRSSGLGPDPQTGKDPAGPPDDTIDISDVLAVLAQAFAVDCSGQPNDLPVTYDYDANGNQTFRQAQGQAADTFVYDHENRLIEATVNSVTSTYEYNGDGLRVSRTVDGATTDYVWDVGSGLPVILQGTAAGGTTYYIYGLDLISQVEGETTTYYLYDGLGSTTELADGSGDVTGAYRYDVFGVVRQYEGPADTHFRFTGEQWDAETDFYYLRARYYDPAIGRFVSRDPWPGSPWDGQSQNPYAYVRNSPALFADPAGLWCPWNPEDCVPDPVEDFFTETVPAAAGWANHNVVQPLMDAVQYCAESPGRSWECYERYMIAAAGVLAATGGVLAGAVGCIAVPAAFSPTGPGGWTLAGVVCAEGLVAMTGGFFAGGKLIEKALSSWEDPEDTVPKE